LAVVWSASDRGVWVARNKEGVRREKRVRPVVRRRGRRLVRGQEREGRREGRKERIRGRVEAIGGGRKDEGRTNEMT
jgi:hypothetical protein